MTRENELFNRIKKGDSAALEDLISYYYPEILRYCLWHAQNKESAEDATQETFLKAIRYMDGYTHKGQYKSFLYKIAANTCVDMHRRKCNSDVSLEQQLEEYSYAEKGFVEIESDMQLRQMVAKLPEDLRELIILRYAQELSVKEIAEIIDIPFRTVQSRIRKALKILKTQCQKGGGIYADRT